MIVYISGLLQVKLRHQCKNTKTNKQNKERKDARPFCIRGSSKQGHLGVTTVQGHSKLPNKLVIYKSDLTMGKQWPMIHDFYIIKTTETQCSSVCIHGFPVDFLQC